MTVLVAARPTTRERSISSFEFWPGWIFYTPVVLFWILLGLRHRSFTLPTAANPRVETGGLCGERKSTVLDQAGPEAAAWIAPYVVFRTGTNDLERAQSALDSKGLGLPLVVKPDIGCNGTGVRLVETVAALADSLAAFPRDTALVLQELVPFDGEAGIFYIREPGALTGHISSLTLKQAPILLGDGRSSLRELILADERSGQIPEIYMPRLTGRLDHVLAASERFRLVFAGNHCKGSIFSDGSSDITRALTARVDAIMRDIPDFHFGRMDVRFESQAALRAGDGFRIIEINGVGSEATHIWDRATRLRTAYLDQFRHYKIAFEIGAEMRRRGARPSSIRELFSYWRLQRRLMSSYPLND